MVAAGTRETGVTDQRWHRSTQVSGSTDRLHANLELMDTTQIVALLVAERDRLNKAIEALQGPTPRGGSLPKTAVAAAIPVTAPAPAKKRRGFSAAQRRKQAERMKAFWAAKRKAATAPPAKKKARAT